jgi:CRISPR-associated DxTHG motif protein
VKSSLKSQIPSPFFYIIPKTKQKEKQMKKAVITILGVISCKKYEDGKIEYKKESRAHYEVSDELENILTLKNSNYTNMLPVVIENFYPEYDIVPVYTTGSKKIQTEVLKICEDDHIENVDKVIKEIFDKGIFIEDENQFRAILTKIDEKIREYDEVIIDVSHGFRHLPILMTIDLIITSLKEKGKIRQILFAEEIVQYKKYKIVDLKHYLELSNIAFLINTFKDNYTVSKHIQLRDKEFLKLAKTMRQFSDNLMGLSIEHLLNYIVPKLLTEIENIKDELFSDELQEIKRHIQSIYTKKEHRYITFYNIAKDVKDKGYLVLAISLMFEGIGFYIKSAFSALDENLKLYFDEFEKKIENQELSYYDMTNLTKAIFTIQKGSLREVEGYNFGSSNKDKFYQFRNQFCFGEKSDKFIKLLKSVRDLRNNLLHANSGETIENITGEVNNLLREYKRLIIDDNYLSNNSKFNKKFNKQRHI